MDYGGKGPGLGYPAEGLSPMGRPFNGHLWDRAAESKVTYRSYGEFCGVEGTNEENLKGHFNSDYHSFELKYSDLDRTQVLLKEFHEFEKSGNLPQLMIIRLPNDHTSGSSKGAWTPRAMVGQNDLALGQIIDAFSHSKFWKQMAIFIVEDDAQNGSDHVDAHRSLGMLISPYVKRSYVDHTMYSTASFLRTMELILGIQPMTQFDGGARPCYNSFINQPDFTPYNCQPPKWNITERNSDNAYGQARMDEFNLTKEDSAPDIEFNEIIWKSIKGADSEMPAPVRAGFILSSDID